MFNALKNLGNKQTEVSVAVEYVAPHWVVLIRNPGQKGWNALRSTTRKVSVQNEFGEVVKTFPAIEPFKSKADAQAWITEHLGSAATVTRRDSEIEKFLMRAKSPVGSLEVTA
jgi:hypothetical protein